MTGSVSLGHALDQLRQRAEASDIHVPIGVLLMIAEQTTNFVDAERVLMFCIAFARHDGADMTHELAADLIEADRQRRIRDGES